MCTLTLLGIGECGPAATRAPGNPAGQREVRQTAEGWHSRCSAGRAGQRGESNEPNGEVGLGHLPRTLGMGSLDEGRGPDHPPPDMECQAIAGKKPLDCK